MSPNRRSLVVPSAVYLGAVALVGLPATAILSSAFGMAIDALGWEWLLTAPGHLVVLGVSLLIGLQLAVEAAAVQLGGIEALGRGSPRVALVRYLTLATSVFVALAVVTWVGLSTAFGEYGAVPLVLGLLVALAGLLALYRGSSAFVTGLRSGEG